MPLGIRSDHRVNVGDTAELHAVLYNENEVPIPATDIDSVEFTVQAPDGEQTAEAGSVLDSGEGFYRWATTDQLGEYIYLAQFTLLSGEIRSRRGSFEVIDPFNPPEFTAVERVENAVWLRLEDCFDSDEGGPWLRDMTLAYFNKTKIHEFITDAMFDINMAPPMTHAVIGDFTTIQVDGTDDPESTLLVQGTLLAVIRHLMRSYVEQPQLTGAQAVYEDRRDYLQRWQLIYQMEMERYNRWIVLWKRQFVGNHRSMLVSSKAGRLLPAPLRSRNIGRGYWSIGAPIPIFLFLVERLMN
jgi:hypothetical protein